ncbi:MAG TPA: DUF3857 domain-containing protein [Bacteroidia bacterium]|nr:DUF3857 domain-containing protein [Bacteroidia bacterium]
MRKKIFFLFLVVLYVSCLKAAVSIAEPAKWIKPEPLVLAESIPVSEVADGYYYMLSDVQVNIEKKHFYYHKAYRIISEAGVQNSSELNFNYDPSYQKLIVHSVKVYRGNKCIDKTHKVKIKEIQRETGLEEHVYDESISALIVLDDIRPEDIVEYEYSVIGSNPIFEGKFYYNFYFYENYEFLNVNFRVLKPTNRNIQEKVFNSNIKAQRKIENGQEEIIYHAKHIKGVKLDSKLPHSFNPYPSIELSEYQSWQEVGEWAKNLFSVKTTNSKVLEEKIEEIKNTTSEKSKQLILAVRFVQDQIRYMGFEMGVNSHKPADPNKVIGQRYGDCKDKSFLLCKMLEELGIKAWPALVSTAERAGIKNYLVSPLLFNHCIVKTELDGQFHWFDPTVSYQRGDINSYYTPNYDLAYVIGADKNELEEMPVNTFSQIITEETYRVDDFSGKATLKINTTYLGADADVLRNNYANTSIKSMNENLLNYYKTYFKEITQKSLPVKEDDEINDKLVLHEEYLINDFWTYPDSTNRKKLAANIYEYMIREKLLAYTTADAQREMPIYLDYPVDIKQSTKVILPEDWTIKADEHSVHNEFIDFSYNLKNEKNIVEIQTSYKSLTNQIPAKQAKGFINLLDNLLENNSGIMVTYNKDVAEKSSNYSINWLLLIIFILFLAVYVFLAFYIYRKKPKTLPLDENGIEIKHETLGGWLILPLIGLILTPFLCAATIFNNNYFNLNTWNILTVSGSSAYNPLWAPGLVLELLLTTLVLVFSIMLCVMFFTYDKRTPKFMIAFLILKVVVELVSLLFLLAIPAVDEKTIEDTSSALVKLVIAAAVWIPYFITSERCKETFTR